MSDLPEPAEPANLKFLRRLITILTAVMIVGVIGLIGLLVTRISASPPSLPDTITLPDGARASAFTQGDTWFAVVTTDQRILIYDRLTGVLRQSIAITQSP